MSVHLYGHGAVQLGRFPSGQVCGLCGGVTACCFRYVPCPGCASTMGCCRRDPLGTHAEAGMGWWVKQIQLFLPGFAGRVIFIALGFYAVIDFIAWVFP